MSTFLSPLTHYKAFHFYVISGHKMLIYLLRKKKFISVHMYVLQGVLFANIIEFVYFKAIEANYIFVIPLRILFDNPRRYLI